MLCSQELPNVEPLRLYKMALGGLLLQDEPCYRLGDNGKVVRGFIHKAFACSKSTIAQKNCRL
jgi:hypothetical protein